MNSTIFNDAMTLSSENLDTTQQIAQNLSQAKVNQEYLIKGVVAGDADIEYCTVHNYLSRYSILSLCASLCSD